MPHRTKTGGAKRLHETVCMGPAIETEAETVGLKHAIHLGIGGCEPCRIVVARHDAPVSRLVAHEIRRVGQDEIDASVLQHRQSLEAVGIDDGVGENVHVAVLSSRGDCRKVGAALRPPR